MSEPRSRPPLSAPTPTQSGAISQIQVPSNGGSPSSLQTQVGLDSVALAFLVSATVGLFFGIYPATRASRLNPIEALRYE